MSTKSTQSQSKKAQSPTLKKAPKKQSAKEKLKAEEDDFNSPVFIEPKKGKDVPYERPLMDPPDDDKSKKELSVEVLKASIKNEIFLSASWKVVTEDDKGSYDKEGENPIHPDLKSAFAGLNKYLASMASQYNDKGKIDAASVVCKGFSIGSNGEGVTLHGTRLLSNGKAFNFNSPFYKWDTEQSGSLFENDKDNDLRGAVNTCRAEVILYLYKHKYQPSQN